MTSYILRAGRLIHGKVIDGECADGCTWFQRSDGATSIETTASVMNAHEALVACHDELACWQARIDALQAEIERERDDADDRRITERMMTGENEQFTITIHGRRDAA